MTARLGNIFGFFLLALGISEIFPIMIAFYYDETAMIVPFFICALVTCFIGGVLYLAFRDFKVATSRHEMIMLLVLLWFVLPLFGSLPFMITGELTKLSDAYFEATSALTTTGSSVISNPELAPKAILFWRSLLQWLGGILIFVLAIAILPLTAVGGLEQSRSALPHGEGEGIIAQIRYAFLPLIRLYLLLTIICIIFLRISGQGLFTSVMTAMATLSSGGFTTTAIGAENGFGAWTEVVLIPFMLIAATNYTYHWALFSKARISNYKKDPEIYYMFLLSSAASILIFLSLWRMTNFDITEMADNMGLAIFTAVSSISTTGFYPDEAANMPLSVVIICSILLFVGGTTDSTAGGFKQLRIVILFRHAYGEIRRLIHPNGVVPLRMNDMDIQFPTLQSVWALLFIFMASAGLIAVVYGAMGYDFQTSLGLMTANLFSTGGMMPLLAPDFVGYDSLSLATKWLTSFVMILGRLEIIIFLVFFTAAFWKK